MRPYGGSATEVAVTGRPCLVQILPPGEIALTFGIERGGKAMRPYGGSATEVAVTGRPCLVQIQLSD